METSLDVITIILNCWVVYFVFGLIIGSFLNVVICRVPEGISIVSPPSSCPTCDSQLKWYHNIPLLSWIALGGKCGFCKTPVSIQYPLVELITGLLSVLVYSHYGASVHTFIIIILSYILLSISVIDLKTYSVPDKLVRALLVLAVISIVGNFLFPNTFLPDLVWYESLLGVGAGFLLLYLIKFIGRIIYKQDAMGGGDLFILGYSGAFIGYKGVLYTFIFASFLAVVFYIIPWIINTIKRAKIVDSFINQAEKYEDRIKLTIDEQKSLNGLKIQLFNQMNKEFIVDTKVETNRHKLEMFFRYAAVSEEEKGVELLKEIEFDNELASHIDEVSDMDVCGYFDREYNIKYLLSKLPNEIKEKLDEKSFFTNLKYYTIEELEENLKSLEGEEKILRLLELNKLYQYGGYTEEQQYIESILSKELDNCDTYLKQKAYANLAFVFYTDMYYKKYAEYVDKLEHEISLSQTVSSAVVFLNYKLALFRQSYFKQKLAFGPYLAAGVLIVELYLEEIINFYWVFMKSLLN